MCKGLFYQHWEGRSVTQCRFNDLLSCSCWSRCYLLIYLYAIFTDFFLLICSIRSASTGYDSVSGTILTGKRSVCTFVPVLLWALTIRYVNQVCCNDQWWVSYLYRIVVSEPWKELVYVADCKLYAPALNPENHSTVFFFRACTICIYKEVKLLGYCVIPKRREVLRTLENCRRNGSTSHSCTITLVLSHAMHNSW